MERTKTNPELKSNRRILGNQKFHKNCITKKKGKNKIQTNVKWRWEKHYISTKTNPELKPNRRIPKNQKSNKNCKQKKKEKKKSNNKNFMILLCHRFDNKERRRKRGNLQRKKNLNPKQPTATNQQNSMKNKNKQKKKLKSKASTN